LNATDVWINSLKDVIANGKINESRGLHYTEVLNQLITFDMNEPICYHPSRKLNYSFMAAEAYWITSGSSLVEDISPYCKHIKYYSDDGYIFNGAYGPQFSSQLEYVVNCLEKDEGSRQAVIDIWHKNPEKSKDQKCTLSLVFNIRNKVMHTTVTIRSNDMFLGRPYDMFNFTIMSLRVLTRLNEQYADVHYELGTLTLLGISSHIYDKDFLKCDNLVKSHTIENHDCNKVPQQAKWDWYFVVRSLLSCRDDLETKGLWRIKP